MREQDQNNFNQSPSTLALLVAESRASDNEKVLFADWLASSSPLEIASAFSQSFKDEVTGVWDCKGTKKLYDNECNRLLNGSSIGNDLAIGSNALFTSILDIEGMGYANRSKKVGFAAVNACLLKPMGESLQATARFGDIVGRHGGDEFIVIGPAQFSAEVDLSEVASRFALNALSGLLAHKTFNDGFKLDSVGIIAKSGMVTPQTEWDQVLEEIDPKHGLDKTDGYDYTTLPKDAKVHRVYIDDATNKFASLGYLTTTRDGGWFVSCTSKNELKELLEGLATNESVTSFTRYQELTASEVPGPYLVGQQPVKQFDYEYTDAVGS